MPDGSIEINQRVRKMADLENDRMCDLARTSILI